MAWMLVRKEVNWSRPKSKFSFNAKPKLEPQSFPHDFVEYAVSIGRAAKVPAPKRKPKATGAQPKIITERKRTAAVLPAVFL